MADQIDPLSPERTAKPNRTLMVAILGGVVGLLIAGFGLFTARGTSTFIVPPEDVALVNQQPIARTDFLAELQSSEGVSGDKATRAQRQRVLNGMIRDELLVQRAKELDLAGADSDIRSAMIRAAQEQAEVDATSSQPTTQQLKAFYLKNRANYRSEGAMTVRVLAFPTLDAAASAAQALRSGHPLNQVLAQSRGSQRPDNGEEFYFAAKIHLGGAPFDAATRLAAGEVSDPIPTPPGYEVIVMVENKPPHDLPFETVEARVMDDYRLAAADRLRAGTERFLRERANILIAGDLK